MLGDLIQDARVAMRGFCARPSFALVAILMIALAIGANTISFGVLRGVVLRPLPYQEPERLVVVWPNHFLSYREVTYLRDHTRTLSGVGAWVPGWSMTLTGSGEPAKLAGARMTANLFSVLGVAPAAGRLLLVEEEAPGSDAAVVLSHGLWRTRFGGDTGILGQRIILDGTPHTVTGVMPAGFELYQPKTGGSGSGRRRWRRPARSTRTKSSRPSTTSNSATARVVPLRWSPASTTCA